MSPPAVILAVLTAFLPTSPMTELHPTQRDAVEALARDVAERLYLSSELEDPRIRIIASADRASRRTLALLDRSLRRHGHPVIPPGVTVQGAAVARLVISTRDQCPRIELRWRHPSGPPTAVAYGGRAWLETTNMAAPSVRADSGGTHSTPPRAHAAAMAAARERLIDLVEAAMPRHPSWPTPTRSHIRSRIANHLTEEDVRTLVRDRFLARTGGPIRPDFRVLVLLHFPPQAVANVARRAAADLAAEHRRLWGRIAAMIAALIGTAVLYLWADHRTRGYLRAPLRLTAAAALVVLVLGAWMI